MDSRWTRVVHDTGAVNTAVPLLTTPDARPSQAHAALRHLHPAAVEGRALAMADEQTRGALGHYLAELRQVRPILRGADAQSVIGELTARAAQLSATGDDRLPGQETPTSGTAVHPAGHLLPVVSDDAGQ